MDPGASHGSHGQSGQDGQDGNFGGRDRWLQGGGNDQGGGFGRGVPSVTDARSSPTSWNGRPMRGSQLSGRWTTQHQQRRPRQDVVPKGSDPTPVRLATEEFSNTFANGSYTTLNMVDFWIQKRGISYEQYVQNRTRVLDQDDHQAYQERSAADNDRDPAANEFPNTKRWLQRFPDQDFATVVLQGTGRCTSFAIETVENLHFKHQNVFAFDFYRLGNHHLARCKNTGTVIDSSCKKGAFILQPGEEMAVVSATDRWTYVWTFFSPELSRFTKKRVDDTGRLEPEITQESTEPVQWRTAIHYCLIDLACKESYQPNNERRPYQYHGMIKWSFATTMEMQFTVGRHNNVSKIVFGEGDDETNAECWFFLQQFVERGDRGVSYQEQFGKVAPVVEKLWEAGVEVYGFPRLFVSTMSGSDASSARSRRRAREGVQSASVTSSQIQGMP